MAQNFRNQLTHTAIGTSPVDILAQADTYDTVVGIRLVNVAASAINVDCYIVNSSNNTYLIKNCPLPAGSSIELIDGGAKVILMNGDRLLAQCGTANGIDAWISTVDAVST